jgi:(heptosyl)LPS beta-1,4-glucosyltransferase
MEQKRSVTPLSVVIMTKNEEAKIARCIRSSLFADEIVIIDSGSTDKTKEIARAFDAQIYEQPWLGFSAQRNKGASLAKHDWVLFLDADEVVSSELAASIQNVMHGPLDERDAFSFDRRGDFLGVLLPNESRPSKRKNFIRLYNRHFGSYDTTMNVHEEVRFPGKAIPLSGVLYHWNGHTMDELISLFNRYATLEAQELNRLGKRTTALEIFVRPILRFLWSYVIKGGFRLGTRGLIHSLLKGSSDFMRYAKLWELQNVTRTLHPPGHGEEETSEPNKLSPSSKLSQ